VGSIIDGRSSVDPQLTLYCDHFRLLCLLCVKYRHASNAISLSDLFIEPLYAYRYMSMADCLAGRGRPNAHGWSWARVQGLLFDSQCSDFTAVMRAWCFLCGVCL